MPQASLKQALPTATQTPFLATPNCPSQLSLPIILHGMDFLNCTNNDSNTDSFDLNQELIRHPQSTYYMYTPYDNLNPQGLSEGDLLVIDSKIRPQHNDNVVVCIDGELLCRTLDLHNNQLIGADDSTESTIDLCEQAELFVIGVITHSIHRYR